MAIMSSNGRSRTSAAAVSTICCLCTSSDKESRMANGPINRARNTVRGDMGASMLDRRFG